MSKFSSFFLVFCWIFLASFHKPSAYPPNSKKIVGVPVLNMHEECSEETPFVSQSIYGKVAVIIETKEDGWVLIETEDGYRGYALQKHLVEDDILWRTSKNLYRVCSREGKVYKNPSYKKGTLMTLPYGSKVVFSSESDLFWASVQLADGTQAWMRKGDLEKPYLRKIQELSSFSDQFLNGPYIWGGTSSIGYDCSGYVQMLYQQIGIQLPRDSRPQSASTALYEVSLEEVLPGDLLFLGEPRKNSRISHVGMYTGEDKFIQTGIENAFPMTQSMDLENNEYYSLRKIMRPKEMYFESSISEVTDDIQGRMTHSWNDHNPVPLEDLRYLTITHWGFDQCVHQGEMIVHKDVAEEVVEIFAELFSHHYPLEKMLLIDEYQADDDWACSDNNTSAFCSRAITNQPGKWSYHSYGLAIDINPQLNPYHRGASVVPENGVCFIDRSLDQTGLITVEDICYKIFTKHGWKWAGLWQKDHGYAD